MIKKQLKTYYMKKILSILAAILLVVILVWSYYVFAHDMRHAGRIMLELIALSGLVFLGAYALKIKGLRKLRRSLLPWVEKKLKFKELRDRIELVDNVALALLLNGLAVGFAGFSAGMLF